MIRKVYGYAVSGRVVPSTYQGLKNIYRMIKTQEAPAYDFIIIDEFHHCGAPTYGENIKKILDLNPGANILGLTATPVRSSDKRDMAAELFHGDIAYQLPLPEAIRRGILPMPRIILCHLTPEDEALLEEQKRTSQDRAYWKSRARNNIENAHNLNLMFRKFIPDPEGYYIIFCRKIKHVEDIAETCREWFDGISSQIHIFRDYSGRKKGKRVNELSAFAACTLPGLKLLLCVDRLNEAVHLDRPINGLIFLRHTHSQQIYLQQLGRALSAKYKDNQPVIFDIVGNSKVFDMIRQTCEDFSFDLKDHGKEIFFIADFTEQQQHLTFLDLLLGAKQMQHQIPWETGYKAAANYFKDWGNLRVPKNYTVDVEYEEVSHGVKIYRFAVLNLYSWVNEQRLIYHGELGKDSLTESRIKLLEDINIEWDYDPYWMEVFELLKFYHKVNHNLHITKANCPGRFHLDIFLDRMRRRYHHLISPALSEEQIRLLNSLGMDWTLRNRTDQWLLNLKDVEQLCDQAGTLNFPSTGDTARQHRWLWQQFAKLDANELSPNQAELLNRLKKKYDISKAVRNGISSIRACKEQLHINTLRANSNNEEERKCYNTQRYLRKKYSRGELKGSEIELLKEEGIL